MQIIHAGRASALLIVCALSTTVSCGSVERSYRANERSADGAAGSAGKNSGSSGGSRPGGVGTGGASLGTPGSGGTSGPAPAAGGSAPGMGDPASAAGGSASATGGSASATGGSASATGGSASATGGSASATGGSAPATGGGGTMCTGQTHSCLGTCVSNSSVDHCGGACDPCQVPSGATATCDGNQCGFSCGAMKKCGSKCVPSDGCCTDTDCPAQNGMARQCDTSSNTCKASGCASGFKPCGSMCIDSKACCSSNDCGGACQTCSGPGGSCVAVKSMDDSDSCLGTCDNSGTCKSKRGQTCNTVSGGCIGGSPCSPDGYCCDTACTGQCQACDFSGKQGTCTPVATGAPHGNRANCTSDGSTCGGSCNGKSDGTCDYPTVSCGEAKCSSSNMSVAERTCSAGKCPPAAPVMCPNSLICSGKTCKMSCNEDKDCVPDFVCAADHTCGVKPTTKIIYFDTALSGQVISNGNVITPLIGAGDDSSNNYTCGFASFRLSEIPKGSVVTAASLSIYQIQAVGMPYEDLAQLSAHKVKYTVLDKSALSVFALAALTMSDNAQPGTKTLNVTSMVSPEVTAGAANMQFRFCFARDTDNDKVGDFVQIASANNKPELSITYHP